jgi:thymidine kinase
MTSRLPFSSQPGFTRWLALQDQGAATRNAAGRGMLNVIIGPEHSAKTSELDSRAITERLATYVRFGRNADVAPRAVKYYIHELSPLRGTHDQRDLDRFPRSKVSGPQLQIERQADSERIRSRARDQVDALFIDDAHLYGHALAPVCEELSTQLGLDVTIAGRQLTADGRPHEAMPGLLCYADQIDVRTAVCMSCGRPEARSANLAGPICRSCSSSSGSLYMIVGPAFSGKTEEFIREIRQYIASPLYDVFVYYPARLVNRSGIDSRFNRRITASNGGEVEIRTANNLHQIIESVRKGDQRPAVVCIDSVEWFGDLDPSSARGLEEIVEAGNIVVCTAKEVDSSGDYVAGVGHLLCYADRIRKMGATCYRCLTPHRAIRVVEVPVALKNMRFPVATPDHEYRAVCRSCVGAERANREFSSIRESADRLSVDPAIRVDSDVESQDQRSATQLQLSFGIRSSSCDGVD